MPTRAVPLLIAVLILALGTGSSTPALAVPTAASNPSGAQLLAAMMHAWIAANSDSFTDAGSTSVTNRQATTVTTTKDKGAVAWQNPPVFSMDSSRRVARKGRNSKTTRVVDREVQRYAQDLLAVRINHKRWSCRPFFGSSALPGSPQWDETTPWGFPARNLGQATMNGTPVWRVRITPSSLKDRRHHYIDIRTMTYLIAVATNLPVAIKSQGTIMEPGVQQTSRWSMVFTSFGNPVQVALPAACAGTLPPTPTATPTP